jgi:hypothetical protein
MRAVTALAVSGASASVTAKTASITATDFIFMRTTFEERMALAADYSRSVTNWPLM